jgi:prophage regulatory protein
MKKPSVKKIKPQLRLLSADQVMELVPFERSKLLARINAGTFPPPVNIGGRVAWRSDHIERWIESLPIAEKRRGRPPLLAAAKW